MTLKILIVLTSHDRWETQEDVRGACCPLFRFRDAGAITLASPKGGQPPLDPKSNDPEFQTDDTRRFARPSRNTCARQPVSCPTDPRLRQVVFPGGHGPLWDLTNDRNALSLIEDVLSAEKPVALVCHAPGILTSVKAPNGEPIARGRAVTGSTDSEEAAVHLVDVVPYLLEDVLKEAGGEVFGYGELGRVRCPGWLAHHGQNPASRSDRLLDARKQVAA